LAALKKYVEDGGSLFVATGDCKDDPDISSNLNALLKDFGIKVNNDSVIRTVYYKYHHPKQAFINDGLVNKKIATACESWGATKKKGVANDAQQSHEKRCYASLCFLSLVFFGGGQNPAHHRCENTTM
jgi:hypothetical protein